MIITMYGIIVFHSVEHIAFIKKSLKEALIYGAYIKAFPYPAIRTRHEVPGKPYLQEAKIKKHIVVQLEQTHKTIKHCGYGENNVNINDMCITGG